MACAARGARREVQAAAAARGLLCREAFHYREHPMMGHVVQVRQVAVMLLSAHSTISTPTPPPRPRPCDTCICACGCYCYVQDLRCIQLTVYII